MHYSSLFQYFISIYYGSCSTLKIHFFYTCNNSFLQFPILHSAMFLYCSQNGIFSLIGTIILRKLNKIVHKDFRLWHLHGHCSWFPLFRHSYCVLNFNRQRGDSEECLAMDSVFYYLWPGTLMHELKLTTKQH